MFLERARDLRSRLTATERTVWRWLRNRTMFDLKFRRQHPVANYILDFYCAELKLCVEIDGGVHNEFAQAIYDDERSCELSKLGITVVRLLNDDVRAHPCESWEFIVGAVARIVCDATGRTEGDVLRELYATKRVPPECGGPSP